MSTHKYPTIVWNGTEVPAILYKYREWNNEYHQAIVSQRQVYMAPPSSFEDQRDCRNLPRHDLLTRAQILSRYEADSRASQPGAPSHHHRQVALQKYAVAPFRQAGKRAQIEKQIFESLDGRLGVLCLTANAANEEMWQKYATQHQGFVVGFNTARLFDYLGGGGIVKYVPEFPPILPQPWNSEEEQWHKMVFHKTDAWAFEEEYRTTKFSTTYHPLTNQDRQINLPAEAYNSIILGSQMPQEHRDQLMQAAAKVLPQVAVK